MPFPTTPVLTTFTGTDEDPLSEGGNWSGPIQATTRRHKLITNQIARSDVGPSGTWGSYWTPAQFGADSESFGTIAVLPAAAEETGAWVRVHNPGNATTMEGYFAIYIQGTGYLLVRCLSGGTFVQLGATDSTAASVGDKVGVEAIGTSINGYRYTSGAWVQFVSVTDANITGAGYIGTSGASGTTGRMDDFGGGTVVVAGGREYKRFFGPALLSGAAADLYTVPTGKRIRVLDTHVSNPSASAVDLTLSIGTDAAGTRVYDGLSIPADSRKDDFTPYELAAGEKIQGFASSATTLNLTITGYEESA